ncbi:hypothetical protein [Rhizobium sp. Leaf341]|uniref:hypothetical protein n=1 Tax=Rhizobium sp. Leaf341 TaxID=1736344 RepID=UPI000715F191|nr:hypothetical protein [Rhizobium sp. Leaf341]KQR76872.1 hypothetical protein ASG03_18190 [Rhizobium sp. Leaf341]
MTADRLVRLPGPDGRRAPSHAQMPALTCVALALLVLSLLWGMVESRALPGGDPVWLKPAKFALSFALTFGTLALVQARLSAGWAQSLTLRVTEAVMTAAFSLEMIYLTYQAARGEASHFNFSDAFHIQMYQLMGVGAVLLMLGIGVFGIVVLRDRDVCLSPSLRLAIGVGFLLTLVLTLLTAGVLGANGGHLVGTPPSEATNWPLLGWSGTVGDLRPAHFLALHAMQALPLYVLWRERTAGPLSRRHVVVAALGWTALTLLVFVQALSGRPIFPL